MTALTPAQAYRLLRQLQVRLLHEQHEWAELQAKWRTRAVRKEDADAGARARLYAGAAEKAGATAQALAMALDTLQDVWRFD